MDDDTAEAALEFASRVLSDQPEGAQVLVQVLTPTEENNGALVYRRVLAPAEGEEPSTARDTTSPDDQ